MDTKLVAAVGEVVARVAAEEVLPRFGRLAAREIEVKSDLPYDLVTVADRAAEAALAERLTALLPGSVVVGEEAVADDPGILAAIGGDQPVWIVDPIDGTFNYASGNPRFAILAALVVDGEPVGSWTLAPALGVSATATAGGGAFVNGVRVKTGGAKPLRGAVGRYRRPGDRRRRARPVLAQDQARGLALS